ncbi:MAG TPA: DUF4129 domain-containing protein [Thermoanaerobaculia bacterium]|nr:DUF4129 domain-containing protein [Thermoanaerobaculia bacterium]
MTRSLRSSPERALAAFLLAGSLLLGAVPAGARTEDAAVRVKVQEVLKDPRFQREMPPHEEVTDLKESRGNRGPVIDGGGAQVAVPAVGAAAALGKVFFIVLIVVAVVLLIVWLAAVLGRRWWKRAPEAGAAVSEVGGEGIARVREPAFDEATRLAAEGRYAEAVHALLLAAIRHFAERSRVSIQPSRTSRELVRLLPLGAEAREAFSDLVRTVELSLFGGAPVEREEYERSLARFRDLTRRTA